MPDKRTVPPVSIGPYQLLGELGRGGGGQVYRAWDPRLEREVALKMLTRANNNPARVLRFVSEARAASALNHPNIVTVYDAAIEGEKPFIVQEVIERRDAAGRATRRGPISIKRTLDLHPRSPTG